MWEKIQIEKTAIIKETQRASLISIDHGKYAGYKFWHPKKLIRFTDDTYFVSFTAEFKFKLLKNAETSFDVLDAVELSGIEMKEYFDKNAGIEEIPF